MEKALYIKLLGETITDIDDKPKSDEVAPTKSTDDELTRNDGMLITRPALIHYAPREYAENIMANGLLIILLI